MCDIVRMKTRSLLFASLLLCSPATVQLNAQDFGDPTPVLPIGGDQLDIGTVYGPIYNVYDKAGRNYTGVVVGDSDFSVTYPSGGGDCIMKSGDIIINLGK